MADLSPKWPVQADHRFILKVIRSFYDQVVPIPKEFDRISRVFLKAGGSWERLFDGSPHDIGTLKAVIKVAYKHGFLTKKGDWS